MSPNWIIFCLFLLAFGTGLSSVIEINSLCCFCFLRGYLVAITSHIGVIRSFKSKSLLVKMEVLDLFNRYSRMMLIIINLKSV